MAEQRIDVAQELREQSIDVLSAGAEQNIKIGSEPSVLHGIDGVSPIATVTKSGKVATITITDKNGTTTQAISDGRDGQDGNDGFSPTATVTKSGDTATITITDKNGTTTASVSDGSDATVTVDSALSSTSENPVQNKVINSALGSKANSSDIPTKTSDLQNDSGYITDAGVTSFNGSTGAVTYTAPVTSVNGSTGAVTVTVPTKTSDLTNDSGFLTSYTETDPIYSASPAAGITDADISSWNAKSDFSGDYDDLTNKPTIGNATLTIQKNGTNVQTFTANATSNKTANITVPTKTSDLTNDSDFVEDASYVHTDNNYTTAEKNKLAGIAAGAEVNVQANWTQTTTTADDYIKNKPTLATVATSGSYNDLSNKPTIPTVNNATLTIQKNGTTVKTFTANASSNVTANITVPTKTSDLTNDSGFLDSVAWGDVTGKPTFATVATSGSYNDLTNKPTIPAAQVNSDWNATSGKAQILNKPTLATVATSGSYNDLSNKPTIPTAGTITSGSTGYTTGGDVYNAIGDVESILTTLNNGGGAQ